MRVFDSQNRVSWRCQSGAIQAPLRLQRGSAAEALFVAESISKIKIIGRSISGDGTVSVSLKDNAEEVLFSETVKLSKGSSSEVFILCNLRSSGAKVCIEKKGSSPGSVLIDRVVMEGSRACLPARRTTEKELVNYKELTNNMVRNINLAVIIPYAIYGGGEVYLKNLIKYGRKGFNIDVLFLYKNKLIDELSDGNVSIVRLGGMQGLKSRLRPDKYDSIVFYNSKKVYEELVRKKRKEGLTASLIEIYHSDFRWSDSLSSLKKRECVDKIFRVAKGLAKDVRGVAESNKVCIPVSVGEDRFERGLSRPHEIPKTQRIAIGLVARLSPEKNIGYALSLAKRIPEYDFYVIGDGPLRQSVEERVKDESITNVKVLGYKRDIDRYYKVLDGLMLVSKIEGTPLTIAEGLMCGLPIFTTPVGQIKDLYSDLPGVKMLSGDLEGDANILKNFDFEDFDGSDNVSFAKSMHNLKFNRELFFSNISSPLSLVIPDEGVSVLPGEYL